MVREDTRCDFSFLNLLRLDLWPKMWPILENVPCALEKKLYSSTFGWKVLKMSTMSIWSHVSFKVCVSFLTLCFNDLSIGVVSGVLKSPTIIVLLSISPLIPVSDCLLYWDDPNVGCIHIYNCYVFLDWSLDHFIVSFFVSYNTLYLSLIILFILKSILSEIRIAILLSFVFHSHGISFPLLLLSVCMCL